MSLLCARCLLNGKRWPSKLEHVGDDRYARHAKIVLDGLSLCEPCGKAAVADKKRSRS